MAEGRKLSPEAVQSIRELPPTMGQHQALLAVQFEQLLVLDQILISLERIENGLRNTSRIIP